MCSAADMDDVRLASHAISRTWRLRFDGELFGGVLVVSQAAPHGKAEDKASC